MIDSNRLIVLICNSNSAHLEGIRPLVASGKVVAGGTSSLLFFYSDSQMSTQPENFVSILFNSFLPINVISAMHY
jgi:hypothetical protein